MFVGAWQRPTINIRKFETDPSLNVPTDRGTVCWFFPEFPVSYRILEIETQYSDVGHPLVEIVEGSRRAILPPLSLFSESAEPFGNSERRSGGNDQRGPVYGYPERSMRRRERGDRQAVDDDGAE